MNMREIRQAISALEDALDSANEDESDFEEDETIEGLKEELLEWKKKYEELEGAQNDV